MAAAAPGNVLRVATLNLWGLRGDWPARRSVIAAGLAELNPDLVALQESVVTEERDQVAEILPSHHLVHQRRREPDGQGVSIASRWPVAAVHEVDLDVSPRTADFACTTLVAEIDAPIGALLFVNHLPNWQLGLEYEREQQAVVAARFVEGLVEETGRHVVLAGDMDADPEAASIRFWSGRQSLDATSVCYRDAWASARPGEAGHTFVPDNPLGADWDWPFRRIDYIFVRCGEHGGPTLAVRSCRQLFERPVDGVWASDHFGVTADLVPPL
jgi:endonuclease/exonuclease/phosphatase family metal-dependent hydrolase